MSTENLIRELRAITGGTTIVRIARAAADALEAVTAERDELAAVIQKAKLAPVQRVPNAVGLSGTVSDVLREAPADVLREHDAALIEALAERAKAEFSQGSWAIVGATPQWIRERARQVREGEA